MDPRLTSLLIGTIIITIGFAYGLSVQNQLGAYVWEIQHGMQWYHIFDALPNLSPGIPIIIGGIVIIIIELIYFREKK